MVKNYLLLAVEGVDGSGKTSTLKGLEGILKEHYNVISLKDPESSSPEFTRVIQLMKKTEINIDERKELVMRLAISRRTNITNAINANRGKLSIILTDRYYLSSCVYQSLDSGLTVKDIERINKELGVPSPDILTVFDMSPELAMSRIMARPRSSSSIDSIETISAIRKARRKYIEYCTTPCMDLNTKIILIDASSEAYSLHSTYRIILDSIKGEISSLRELIELHKTYYPSEVNLDDMDIDAIDKCIELVDKRYNNGNNKSKASAESDSAGKID